MQKMQPRRSKGGCVCGEREATPRDVSQRAQHPRGTRHPQRALLSGCRGGREGLRLGYSQQGADKGGKPPRNVSQRAQHTPSGILLAGHRQGREAPEGRIPACTTPPAGYSERDTGTDGKAFKWGIPACTTPPAGYSERDTGKEGKASEGRIPACPTPPAGYRHGREAPEGRIPAGAPRCAFSGVCVRPAECGSACALYNKVTELQKMQPRRSKGGCVCGEREATPRDVSQRAQHPRGTRHPQRALLSGCRGGREGLRLGYSQQGADKGGKPPRNVSQRAQHTPSGILLAGHRQGREAPEGRIPACTTPPAGYSERDTGTDGKAFKWGIPACTTPPAGYSERDTGKEGKASEGRIPACPTPPAGYRHGREAPEGRIPAGAPRCAFSGVCVRPAECGSACALYNKVTELQKMQPRRSKGGCVCGEREATPRDVSQRAQHPRGTRHPQRALLSGCRGGREGLRLGYSQQGADKGGKPPRNVSQRAQHTPSGILLAGHRQGREAPDGCIPVCTVPPAGYREQDTGKVGGRYREGRSKVGVR